MPEQRTTAALKSDPQAVLAWLKQHGDPKLRAGMTRYGLPNTHAHGVPMQVIQSFAKQLGRDQALASALWKTGCYEARLLTAYIGKPDRITSAEMDRWCRDFDNWGVVDTLCFSLFDRTPQAWSKVRRWAELKGEFQRRAGFVLLACLAAHDEAAEDAAFLDHFPLIESGAEDERNFVKKGVSWALRMIGRRNAALHRASVDLAQALSASQHPAARWIGKDAAKQLAAPTTLKAIARKNARVESKARER